MEHNLFRKPVPTFRDHALADESCDFRVVRALRAAGHDVTTVVEVAPGAEDATIIEMAVRERRVFVTEDRDFGQLVYASATPTSGVILLRFHRRHVPTCPQWSWMSWRGTGKDSASASSCSNRDEFVSAEFPIRESTRKIGSRRRAAPRRALASCAAGWS
jgi:hypothetical protein